MMAEKAPLIIPEQRLLLYLNLFGWSIVLFHQLGPDWHQANRLDWLCLVMATCLSCLWLVAYYWRGSPGVCEILLMSAALLSGVTMAALQFNLHEPKRLVSGITERVSGVVILIDGQADHRNRLWVRLDNAVGTEMGRDCAERQHYPCRREGACPRL